MRIGPAFGKQALLMPKVAVAFVKSPPRGNNDPITDNLIVPRLSLIKDLAHVTFADFARAVAFG
jgi:hypothetical protein